MERLKDGDVELCWLFVAVQIYRHTCEKMTFIVSTKPN